MRAELEVLLGNLNALKREGVTDVFVSEEALSALRERVVAAASAVPPAKTIADAPPPKPVSPQKSRANEPAARVPAPDARASASAFPSFSPENFYSAEKTSPVVPTKAPPSAKKEPEFDFSVSEARAASVPASGSNAERLAVLCGQMQGDPICNEHLHAGKQLVFGEGNPEAGIFFCGEAPGAEEETEGRPFVGPAGQLLTKMIAATGLSREQVYIGNIMKWRPELPTLYGNRPPTPDEMRYCLPYLSKQVEIIRPRVIVALGLTAVNGLLGFDPDRRIGVMRGKSLEFKGVPVVATYHPSYLLRNDSMKSKRAAWEDFLRMMEIAGLPITERQRNFFLPKK